MSSLRSRIALGVIGITSGVVLVASVGVWLSAQTFLMRGVDSELISRIDRVRRMSGPGFTGRDRPRPPEQRPAEQRQAEQRPPEQRNELRRLLRIVAADGTVWPTPAPEDPDLAALAPRDLPADQPASITLADGQRMRLMMARLERPEGVATAWLAIDLDPAEAELRRLAIMLGSLWLAATTLAVVAVFLLRSTLVRPLRELDAAIDRLGPDDLAARLPRSAGPAEVRGTVSRLNQLLDRLEQAFRREQTTIANLAHELRTPVAALRTTIEFRRLAATDPGEREVLDDAFRTIARMQRLVTDLLLLARLEAGKEPLLREAVDIGDVVLDVLDVWQPRANSKQQRLEHDIRGLTVVTTSADHLHLVLGNLVGNAVHHAPDGAAISITLADDVLTVSNPLSAPLDPSQLGLSFYRGDAARSDGDHCGLGLALCRRLADVLGMQLELRTDAGRFTAILRLGG